MQGIPHGGNPAGKRLTRKMVQKRTRELALLAGRAPPHLLQADYEQAKRELTGASELDQQEAILDANDRPVRPNSAPDCAG
jgi:hypothetical protein